MNSQPSAAPLFRPDVRSAPVPRDPTSCERTACTVCGSGPATCTSRWCAGKSGRHCVPRLGTRTWTPSRCSHPDDGGGDVTGQQRCVAVVDVGGDDSEPSAAIRSSGLSRHVPVPWSLGTDEHDVVLGEEHRRLALHHRERSDREHGAEHHDVPASQGGSEEVACGHAAPPVVRSLIRSPRRARPAAAAGGGRRWSCASGRCRGRRARPARSVSPVASATSLDRARRCSCRTGRGPSGS